MERPILFSGPMVRAILEGRKTQTRRIAKLPPFVRVEHGSAFSLRWDDDEEIHWRKDYYCPCGAPGDRLWVRETFGYAADGSRGIYYKADDVENNWVVEKWQPSIHMPRLVSRLTLEVVSVRVERVQDISEADAVAEGVTVTEGQVMNENLFAEFRPDLPRIAAAQQAFSELWNSINAGRGHGWEKNDWVWVVEFKKL